MLNIRKYNIIRYKTPQLSPKKSLSPCQNVNFIHDLAFIAHLSEENQDTFMEGPHKNQGIFAKQTSPNSLRSFHLHFYHKTQHFSNSYSLLIAPDTPPNEQKPPFSPTQTTPTAPYPPHTSKNPRKFQKSPIPPQSFSYSKTT